MQTIRVLPENLANKIAAGEVVQRPASAVKELIENSIDAGARSVTVVIEEGGKTSLRVVDDGDGMSREDARMAFERHATSKIATYEDLENIRTLGFRGEALASIAAVARVEMKTRPASAAVGTVVRIDGGAVRDISDIATAPGTSVLVKNLFYNTPGRRNFLKSTPTEYKHIFDVVAQAAIARPEMTIRFDSDGETILHLLPKGSRDRVRDIVGDKLGDALIPLAGTSEQVSIDGFLGRPEFARRSRAEQYLYMNGRYVINRTIGHAVYQAYEHLLEKGTFPLFVLFLSIDPRRVDVNVHPSKMEVKFADESSVYRFVLSTVRNTLSANDLVPGVRLSEAGQSAERIGLTYGPGGAESALRRVPWIDMIRPQYETASPATQPASSPTQAEASGRMAPAGAEQVRSEEPGAPSAPQVQPAAELLWQIHRKYIILPVEGAVLLVDQHAAHERVLYERAVAQFKETNARSQQLLFPQTIQMTAADAALVKDLEPMLRQLGFNLKFFGPSTVILDGVPIDVRPGEEGTILQSILDLYKEDTHTVKLEPRERLAKSYSCKAAIKAGDPLKETEMRSLIDQLFATEIPYVCPHGRPVMIKLSLAELDRRFGRSS